MKGGHLRLDGPVLVAAAIAVCLVYWRSLSFDLFEDDYFLLRPWSPAHLSAVLTGPWLAADQPDYYRPLAIYLFKALFFLFGLNTAALHVVPLVVMTVVATLVGLYVRRETDSVPLGVLSTVLYAWHPATATAVGPWVANQYQGIVSACVLLALLWWRRCRHDDWPRWLPMLVPILVAALTKESGLLLPLMVISAHLARQWWCGTLPPLRWPVIAAGLVVFVALNVWRVLALGTLGETLSWPAVLTAFRFAAGAAVVLLDPLRGPVTPLSVMFAVGSLTMVAAAVYAIVYRRSTPAAGLAIVGFVVLLWACVPTSLVFSRERLTPHGTGAVLVWAGGLAALSSLLHGRRRTVMIAAGSVALAATASMTLAAVAQFGACRARTLEDPHFLLQEARMPPPEMVAWLVSLPKPCRSRDIPPMYRSVPSLTWGVVELLVGPDEVVHRWIGDRVVALVEPTADVVRVELRHVRASATSPIRLRVTNAGVTSWITLTSPDWHSTDVTLRDEWLVPLRRMHRLEIYAEPGRGSPIEMRPLEVSSIP